MTAELIMSSRLCKVQPDTKVAEACQIMHREQVRNLPVVDEAGAFIGLFGIRRLARLLLPKAAAMEDRHRLIDLSFMPDELGEMYDRLQAIGNRPIAEFLEKKKKLLFCSPNTTFPELLELLDQSTDTSLPVIVVSGKKRKLVGMVSFWDVLEKLVINVFAEPSGATKDCHDPEE
ncbi:MAG: CBS domain-containing protein [Candidatus Thiodiazotropha sp. (ex Epidulcina cf. delphinae)]|nr:CBS domain-containing protein [Candidatus Thiodiazotropha sp. (ex Epidulcina cf. delphinae)]